MDELFLLSLWVAGWCFLLIGGLGIVEFCRWLAGKKSRIDRSW